MPWWLGPADLLTPPGAPAEVLLLGAGPMATTAAAAAGELCAAGLPAAAADPRWLLPVDPALVAAVAGFRLVVTIEDGGVAGGFGDAVSRALREARAGTEVLSLGLAQRFLHHGEREDLLAAAGLDVAGVVRRVQETVGPVAAVQPRRTAVR